MNFKLKKAKLLISFLGYLCTLKVITSHFEKALFVHLKGREMSRSDCVLSPLLC